MTFLFDANLSIKIPRALQVLGEAAEHVGEHLGPGVPDPDWLRLAGEKGWFIVTQDNAILGRPEERAALTTYGVGAFFLDPALRGHCNIARHIIRHWPEMKRIAHRMPRPFVMEIRENGVRPLRHRR